VGENWLGDSSGIQLACKLPTLPASELAIAFAIVLLRCQIKSVILLLQIDYYESKGMLKFI